MVRVDDTFSFLFPDFLDAIDKTESNLVKCEKHAMNKNHR